MAANYCKSKTLTALWTFFFISENCSKGKKTTWLLSIHNVFMANMLCFHQYKIINLAYFYTLDHEDNSVHFSKQTWRSQQLGSRRKEIYVSPNPQKYSGACATHDFHCYLWVVSQVDLSGDVVHGANPLRREKITHTHTQKQVSASCRSDTRRLTEWHQLWRMRQSPRPNARSAQWAWTALLFECDSRRWCRWRWKEYLISPLTSSYSLLLSAWRIIDLDAGEQCRDETTKLPLQLLSQYVCVCV